MLLASQGKYVPRILGTGSFLPGTAFTNERFLELSDIPPMQQSLRSPSWIAEKFGIQERRLDLDPWSLVKHSREEGGLYDGDFAVLAAKAALDDSGIPSSAVDVLVHVTTTPDTTVCSDHVRYLVRGLGLRRDVHMVHHNLGCAGLAAAFESAFTYLQVLPLGSTALVIASQCVSGYATKERLDYYRDHPADHGVLLGMVFGDGAGAIVLGTAAGSPRGLLAMGYETEPDIALMDCPAGGCLAPTGWQNIPDHFYSMNAKAVAQYFVPLMRRNVELLDEGWPASLGIDDGVEARRSAIARWYLHQANGPLINRTIKALGLPNELVPLHIEHYGNISAASTLILLDEERRAHLVSEGDLIAFLWVGGGCGTMNGFALAML